MATAFISHASQDREVAERICSFLEERGIRCWMAPRDVRPGRRYGEEIVDGIQGADAVVLVLSENANTSTFVEREIERAVSYGKPTLPVRVREVQPSRSLELFISNAHWIDAWKPPMEQYLDRLADSIRSLSPEGGPTNIGRPPEQSAPSRKATSMWIKPMAIGVLIAVILGAVGFAAWWLAHNKNQVPLPVATSSTPQPVVRETPPSKSEPLASETPRPRSTPTPAPAVVTEKAESAGSPQAAEPVATQSGENSDAVKGVLVEIGNTTSYAREEAIKKYAKQLPAKITTDDLLKILGRTANRNAMIQLLSVRLADPLPVAETLRVMGEAQSYQRSELIEMFAARLPEKLTVDELLPLINGSANRNAMIKLLVGRLPDPVPVADALRIMGETKNYQRSELIEMFAARLPRSVSTNELLALIDGAANRNNMIKLLVNRLPNPLSNDDLLQILGSTSSYQRNELIQILAPRAPAQLSAEEIARLVEGSARPEDAKDLLRH